MNPQKISYIKSITILTYIFILTLFIINIYYNNDTAYAAFTNTGKTFIRHYDIYPELKTFNELFAADHSWFDPNWVRGEWVVADPDFNDHVKEYVRTLRVNLDQHVGKLAKIESWFDRFSLENTLRHRPTLYIRNIVK